MIMLCKTTKKAVNRVPKEIGTGRSIIGCPMLVTGQCRATATGVLPSHLGRDDGEEIVCVGSIEELKAHLVDRPQIFTYEH